MKEIIQGFYQKKHFWTRLILVIAAVILMGFALSWLLLVDLGTDPCTLLNQTISTRLGISIGNWQALFNIVLLIFVIVFGGRNLGFGTLANMFLVGYSIDFFSWIWAKILPPDLFTSMGVRIAVLIPAARINRISAGISTAMRTPIEVKRSGGRIFAQIQEKKSME